MKNRIISLFLLAMLLLISVSGCTKTDDSADDADAIFTVADYEYKLGKQGITIVRYTGEETAVVIPNKIKGKKVTAIGSMAFDGIWNLTSVVIPYGVTVIENNAFNNLYELRSIVIPDSVTHIGDGAFSYTGLTAIAVPASVIHIGDGAFGGWRFIRAINVDENNPAYSSLDGVLFNKDKTELIQYPINKPGVYNIPDSVTHIKDSAFSGSIITAVTIPDSVVYIGDRAFHFTNLTSVTIPGSAAHIGRDVFSHNESLTSVIISEGVATIADSMFTWCRNLASISIPDSVTRIEDFAFSDIAMTEISLSDNVTYLSDWAFGNWRSLENINVAENNPAYSSLDGVLFNKAKTELILRPYGQSGAYNIPTGVLLIGNYAFSNSGTTGVTILDSVTHIGTAAFGQTAITSVIIPGSVQYIGDSAFGSCAELESVVISEGVEHIGSWAFSGCSALRSIDIPGSVTHIGARAFEDMHVTVMEGRGFGASHSYFTAINVAKNNPAFSSLYGVLFNKDKTELIRFPEGKPLENGEYIIPDSITVIREGAFRRSFELVSVRIPNNVTHIGAEAFEFCANLFSVVLSDNMTSIENRLFMGCGNLESIIIPENVTSIGENAFSGCGNLKEIVLPQGLTSIGVSAFSGLVNLTSVIIPASVERIGDSAFAWNENLRGLYFDGNAPATFSNAAHEGYEFSIFGASYDVTCISIPRTATRKIYYRAGTTGWDAPEWEKYELAEWR